MSNWSSSNIFRSIEMARRKINKDKTNYIDAKKKEKNQAIALQLKKIIDTKAFKTIEKILVVFAYIGLALSGWYAAVLNLALLSMPLWVYRTLTLSVAVFGFLSNMVDWLMAHTSGPIQLTESKKIGLEHRFLISPQIRKIRLQFGRRPNIFKDFLEDSLCHRAIRSQVRQLLIDENNREEDDTSISEKSTYSEEHRARWMMSREAKISSDQRGAQLAVADDMYEGHKTILRMVNDKSCRLISTLYKIAGQSKKLNGNISQKQIKNLQTVIAEIKDTSEKMPNVVVL